MCHRNEPIDLPSKNTYDDGNIPEIDLPGQTDTTNIIPDEVPRRDGPSDE